MNTRTHLPVTTAASSRRASASQVWPVAHPFACLPPGAACVLVLGYRFIFVWSGLVPGPGGPVPVPVARGPVAPSRSVPVRGYLGSPILVARWPGPHGGPVARWPGPGPGPCPVRGYLASPIPVAQWPGPSRSRSAVATAQSRCPVPGVWSCSHVTLVSSKESRSAGLSSEQQHSCEGSVWTGLTG